MNKLALILIVLLCGTLWSCSHLKESAVPSSGNLAIDFKNPPHSARPWVYWFWVDGNVTREGITADLEAMERVGIGGVLIMEVSAGTPRGPVAFMSPQWREMFSFALSEAGRLGLRVNMNNDAGWTGSGGPWITPELAMQKLTFTRVKVHGPARFDQVILQPATTLGFYRDIAVLALPDVPDAATDLSKWNPKVSASGGLPANWRKLIDGNLATGFQLSRPLPGSPQHVQIEFDKPYEARFLQLALSLAPKLWCSGRIDVSDDGKAFRTIDRFNTSPPSLALSLPDTTARIYRVVFEDAEPRIQKLGLHELVLSPHMQLGDIQGRAAYKVERKGPIESWPATPAGDAVDHRRIVNISSSMNKVGQLAWDVPAGEWTVLRIGYTPTGKDNHPSPQNGLGLESDKLSKKATEAHFNAMMGKLIADAGPNSPRVLTATHVDSWEVGSQNWTGEFREEFQKRRGYDPLIYLPVVHGVMVDSYEVSERFLWDLRQTISEMIAENYFGHMAELAHRHGMIFSSETYHGPFDEIACAGHVDEPMSNFWLGTPQTDFSNAQMASAAHVYGKRIIGSEAFTAGEHERWLAHPASLKAQGDWAFSEGVNRFVFHRYAMQPWMNRAPGMTMGKWGVHYERTQTWWEFSRPWHEYLARCQYMLQQGLFVADVCYLEPEESPLRFVPPEHNPMTFNADACSPEALMTRMSARDGRLVLPDGMNYRLLVLPQVRTMTPELLAKVKELIEGGATVIAGARPTKSPSLRGFPQCDSQVQQLADQIWGACDGENVKGNRLGSGRLIQGRKVEEVLSEMKVAPDFRCEVETGGQGFRWIHRHVDGAEIYFVSNGSDKEQAARCWFRAGQSRAEFWWPDTGEIQEALGVEQAGDSVQVPIHLDPSGSVFVVFHEKESSHPSRGVAGSRWGTVVDSSELKGPWQIQFAPGRGAPERIEMEKLVSWAEHPGPGVRYFSGTATYQKPFDAPPDYLNSRRVWLDLGRVQVVAQVKLNGKDMGILWKPPFRVDITDALKPTDNRLEISVVNLWPNRMIGDEQLPEDSPRIANGTTQTWPQWLLEGKLSPTGRFTFTTWREWAKGETPVESGLLGPVTIQAMKY